MPLRRTIIGVPLMLVVLADVFFTVLYARMGTVQRTFVKSQFSLADLFREVDPAVGKGGALPAASRPRVFAARRTADLSHLPHRKCYVAALGVQRSRICLLPREPPLP